MDFETVARITEAFAFPRALTLLARFAEMEFNAVTKSIGILQFKSELRLEAPIVQKDRTSCRFSLLGDEFGGRCGWLGRVNLVGLNFVDEVIFFHADAKGKLQCFYEESLSEAALLLVREGIKDGYYSFGRCTQWDPGPFIIDDRLVNLIGPMFI